MKKGNSRPLPRFSKSSAVYDKRTLTIKDRSATRPLTVERVAVEYVLSDYQRSYLDDDDEKRMGTLHYREDEDEFYLHIVLLKEIEQQEGNRVMGVDLNLKNVAVTSPGEFYDGGELLRGQNHYFRVRRSLQNKGTRSAKQTLAQLSGRETRFVLNRLHTISQRLVEEARSHDCSYIAVEQLTHIRDRMDNGNDRIKRQMHNWAFRELQKYLNGKPPNTVSQLNLSRPRLQVRYVLGAAISRPPTKVQMGGSRATSVDTNSTATTTRRRTSV